jgi:hypothetical protein
MASSGFPSNRTFEDARSTHLEPIRRAESGLSGSSDIRNRPRESERRGLSVTEMRSRRPRLRE